MPDRVPLKDEPDNLTIYFDAREAWDFAEHPFGLFPQYWDGWIARFVKDHDGFDAECRAEGYTPQSLTDALSAIIEGATAVIAQAEKWRAEAKEAWRQLAVDAMENERTKA